MYSYFMNESLLCIKLGGSVITDKTKPYIARRATIRQIAKTLKKLQMPLLISHGVGSFAHTSASKYGGKNGYTSKTGIAKVFHDAATINHLVMDIFIEEGLPVVSFQPRSFLLSNKDHVKQVFFAPIIQALDQGLIPVIHGDVIMDEAQLTTIFSGETTLQILCKYLTRNNHPIKRVIQLSDVDGVYDKNKEVISEITSQSWQAIQHDVTVSSNIDVSGGMQHKVEESLELASQGIETMIINGRSKNVLEKVLDGQNVTGTVIK